MYWRCHEPPLFARSFVGVSVQSIAGCAALLLNVCNRDDIDWLYRFGIIDDKDPSWDGSLPEARSTGDFLKFGQVLTRCDETIVPITAREIHAFAGWL
jgi:hypothetical protein